MDMLSLFLSDKVKMASPSFSVPANTNAWKNKVNQPLPTKFDKKWGKPSPIHKASRTHPVGTVGNSTAGNALNSGVQQAAKAVPGVGKVYKNSLKQAVGNRTPARTSMRKAYAVNERARKLQARSDRTWTLQRNGATGPYSH